VSAFLTSASILFKPMPRSTPVIPVVPLNDQGEVIGINTAIRADAMGLVLRPIDKSIKDQLMRGEKFPPYLGVQMATLTPA